MAICGDASKWAKIGFLLALIGLGIFLGGFATNQWMVTKTVLTRVDLSIGMWQMTNCSETGSCYNAGVDSSYNNGAFTATQAFECMVLVGIVANFVLFIIYVASAKARNRCMIITIIVTCCITGFFAFIGMIIWLASLPSLHYSSYSIGLAVFGSVLVLVSGFFLLPDYRKDKYPRTLIRPKPAPPQKLKIPVRTPSPIPYSPTPIKAYPAEKPQRHTKKYYRPPTPETPRTPAALRIQVLSPPPSYRSSLPSYSSQPRRYGTPKASQRYDPKAR